MNVYSVSMNDGSVSFPALTERVSHRFQSQLLDTQFTFELFRLFETH